MQLYEQLAVGLLLGFLAGIGGYWICFRKFCKRRARELWIGEVEKKYEMLQRKKKNQKQNMDDGAVGENELDSKGVEDRKTK